ncbi:hypothetical protein CSW59_01405 [Caulobacter sp. BP25]|nr:hypothetical protein CSW59_01405 [Caulobacter sp. BP25]
MNPLTLPCCAWAPPSLQERGILWAFNERSANLLHPLQNRRILFPPRSTGEGARPATFAALGGGRAGTGSRGILERSGDLVAGQTRPPSAWLEAKGVFG